MHAFGPRSGTAEAWQQELVLALRLRDVPGRRIGEVLAEVEAHCADSGQSPAEAFGDPQAYAAQATPAGRRLPVRSWFPQAVATPLGVVALLEGTVAVVDGVRAALTAGGLLSVLATVVMVAAVVLRFDDVVRRPWRSWLAISLAFVVVTVLPALLPAVVVTLPAQPLIAAGLLLLLAAWWRPGGAGGRVDLVVDPRTGSPAPLPRAAEVALQVLRWGLPAVLLVAVLLVVLVPA